MAIILNGTTGITTPGFTTDDSTFTIDSVNDLIGIGTSIPSAKLDVVGSSTGVAEFNGPANATIELVGSHGVTARIQVGGEAKFGSLTNHPTTLIQNNQEKLRIDLSGNVGIGTTNPTSKLTIYGPVGDSLFLNSAETTTGAIDTGNAITFGGSDGVVHTRLFGRIGVYKQNSTAGDVSSYMSFSTRLHPDGTAEKVRITDSGNVGIGLTNPSTKLHVYGNNNVPRNTLARFDNAGQQNFYIEGQWGDYDIGGSNGTLLYSGETLALRSGTSGNAHMVIRSGGNVGIGTPSPAANLHVGKKENATSGAPGSITRFSIQPYSNTGGPYNFIARTISGSADCLDTYYGPNHIMTWDVNGNVGIGVTNPTYKLHVSANSFIPLISLDSGYVMRAASVFSTGATTFSFTFSLASNSSTYLVTAASAHYGLSSYSCMRQSYFFAGPNSSETNLHNYTTANHGSWSFSWASNVLTVTHTAGSYNGSAYFWASVEGSA